MKSARIFAVTGKGASQKQEKLAYAILLAMEFRYWPEWLEEIQRVHLTPLILTLLDGTGPLKSLVAQGMLAFSPLLGGGAHPAWTAFAETLEDPSSSRSFADYLRQGKL